MEGPRHELTRASWSARRATDVLAQTSAFVRKHSGTTRQAEILETALLHLHQRVAMEELSTFLHFPLLIHMGQTGDDEAALSLATATTLVYLGADILDDLADGDLPADWREYRHSEINLAAVGLLAALPQIALTELGAPPPRLVLLHETLAHGLVRMWAGQQADLALSGSCSPTAAEVEASVSAKSGEELAMFAALAAHLAGARSEMVEACAGLGRQLGIGGQLASDCHDLFAAACSRDLASGTRTLPIALHLVRLEGEPKTCFLALLDRARTEPDARALVRQQLLEAGTLRRCAVIVELHCQQAIRSLERSSPLSPAREWLLSMIDGISFFRQSRDVPHPEVE